MSARNVVAAATQLLMLVSCVLWPTWARAQTAGEPVIAVASDPGIVAPDSLASALAGELGVAVTTDPNARNVIPTVSVVRLASGNVEVSLASRSLPRATRELVLQGTPEEQSETVALIAANLVRNEAASLLPDLRPSAPAPVVATPPARPKPQLVSPCDVRVDQPFGIDFAPGVGTSSSRSARGGTRGFSLGLVGTYSAGLHGFEGSVGVNIKRVSVCGVQLAAGANIAIGPVSGAQLANFNLARGPLVGVQLGNINVALGGVRGVQLATLNFAGGEATEGMQAGVANVSLGDLDGFQGGVVNVSLGGAEGFQAGVANLAGKSLDGFQGGVLNVAIGGVDGFQGGVVNVDTGELDGAQIGAVNVNAGAVRGVQIGVLNYAESSPASIGMFSIVRRGRTSLDAMTSVESGLTLFGITHGGKHVHNVLGLGTRDGRSDIGSRDGGNDTVRLAVMYGLGVRALSTERVRLDVDALAVRLFRKDAYRDNTVIPTLRVAFTYVVWRSLGVTLAPSYQLMITDDPEEKTQSIWGESVFKRGKRRIYGFPGVGVGVRWQFDHGL